MQLDYIAKLTDMGVTWLAANGMKLIGALLVLALGHWISRRLTGAFRRLMERSKVDPLLVRFLGNLAYWVFLVAVAMAAAGQMGIDMTSFLAVLGSLGLAVGLALKDNLANFSSGVLLVLLRPFNLGDYISVSGVAGSVQTISLFNTVLSTPDNQRIIVPNSKIMGEIITNATGNQTRRIDLIIGVGYADDLAKAREAVRQALAADPRILGDPAPVVAVSELGDSSVNLAVWSWVRTAEYWPVRLELLENIKRALDEAGVSIPFPQRDVHLFVEQGEVKAG